MFKIIGSIILAMTFIGCSKAQSTEDLTGPSKTCIDSVIYITFGYGGAPWVNAETMTFSKCAVIDGKITIIK